MKISTNKNLYFINVVSEVAVVQMHIFIVNNVSQDAFIKLSKLDNASCETLFINV